MKIETKTVLSATDEEVQTLREFIRVVNTTCLERKNCNECPLEGWHNDYITSVCSDALYDLFKMLVVDT